jgi:hypothetical protein
LQRLTYTNPRGASIAFDLGAPYVLWKTEGLSLPAAAPISTQAAGQHGYTLHNVLLNNRTVRLTGHVHGKAGKLDMYERRKRLNAVCNPLAGTGTLTYENDCGQWRIGAFVSEIPYVDKAVPTLQTLAVVFQCPNPFWLSTAKTMIALAYVSGGLKFPLKTPDKLGTLGYRAIIDNDSDAETPIELTMDGGSLNPVIINKTTGEFISLARQLAQTDQLYINTDPEALEVSLITAGADGKPVKSNAYGYLSPDSALFTLRPGVNELTFLSDDENKKVRLVISFNKRYVGV